MAKLEDIVAGCTLQGLAPEPVRIVEARLLGQSLQVVYETRDGRMREEMVRRDREPALSVVARPLPWSFAGSGRDLRLVSEAWRIRNAWLFDPYLAVHTSDVEPLPHQIAAVYGEMLGRVPLRYVLADDPGAGKTIMTGLLIRELQARGAVKRCLVVCPGSLAEQWQDELFRKFHLAFDLLETSARGSTASGEQDNVFANHPLLIARLDKLARNSELQAQLELSDWDLVVCDEAHKMSATLFGGEVKATKRYRLGQLLSRIAANFLLLTATPHNGKNEDFHLFLALLDQDRFGGVAKTGTLTDNVSDVMRRLVKEDLLKFDGSPLFPRRHAVTVNYTLSAEELALYDEVTGYVRTQFNRAELLTGDRRNSVGFALTMLQRRLASSPEAICQSLHRRRLRLEERLADARLNRRNREMETDCAAFGRDDFDEEDYSAAELDRLEDLANAASASQSVGELEAEIATLRDLEQRADSVRRSGRDRKWEELSALLQDDQAMYDERGHREKLIIFTEHTDTLLYLVHKIASLLGRSSAVVSIDGTMSRPARRKVEESFRQDPDVCVLVATDAAGEGLNLQRAHLMVNYDLPWNPNRLEQRFGRIHRIGQDRVCWLWNLVAADTREGHVFQRLFEKLEEERRALGGKVFDILGRISFENRPLSKLLLEAVREEKFGEGLERVDARIDQAFERSRLEALLAGYALTDTVFDSRQVAGIRAHMDRMEARKLQPHFVAGFFREAFERLGGSMSRRENGRYSVSHVPACLREGPHGAAIARKYERICFDRSLRHGSVEAELVCPGHPLMEAVLDCILERLGSVLQTGAVLVDEQDDNEPARLLFAITSTLVDGVPDAGGGQRVISQNVHFVEIDEQGQARDAGYAPYLDYRPALSTEQALAFEHLHSCRWPEDDIERLAVTYAESNILPRHVQEVAARRTALADRTERAVRGRLRREIGYWDDRAHELRQEERAGAASAGINSEKAASRADALEGRLHQRLAEIGLERQVSARPPRVICGCLIIPAGLLRKLDRKRNLPDPSADPRARREVELAAMEAVMEVERSLGYRPVDVSGRKCGYDIESENPCGENHLRFIEVKGRSLIHSNSVTVTRNEILTALNKPEQYILAIVVVDGETRQVTYLSKPFVNPPDFAVDSSCYNVAALRASGTVLFEGCIHAAKPARQETH